MSLGIAIKGPEGIVLAAESRITLTVQNPETKETLAVNYDNAQKLLNFSGPHNHIGAVTYGTGGIGLRSAYSYITEFESSLQTQRLSVEEFATKLSSFYETQWNATMPKDYAGPPMSFIVAGFDEKEPYGRVFLIEIPRAPKPKQTQSTGDFGITWGGQREIVDRLLAGYDTRVLDLALFFIRTTIEGQRLTVGIRGVGGPIDIATITGRQGFTWVQRKKLRGEGTYRQPFLPSSVQQD